MLNRYNNQHRKRNKLIPALIWNRIPPGVHTRQVLRRCKTINGTHANLSPDCRSLILCRTENQNTHTHDMPPRLLPRS